MNTSPHLLDDISRFFRWVLGRGEYCVLGKMRKAVGSSYGDPLFAEIALPYWTRGKGTTCAITTNWALEQCGIASHHLNRGNGWISGRHVEPLIAFAKTKNAIEYEIHPSILVPGDYFYIQGTSPADWHVGIVERNDWPQSLITLDGGQIDNRGEQAISRVVRPFIGNNIGPRPRKLIFRIRTEKLF